MTEKNKTGPNGQGSDQQGTIEQRVTILEKEVADLQQQLEGQPFQPHDASDETPKQKYCY